MKKSFDFILVLFLITIPICGSISYAQDQTESSLDCQARPCTVYFKSGRKLVCDSIWREDDTLFLVVHGKKIAIGYAMRDIDLKKSFGTLQPPSRPTLISPEALLLEVFEKSGFNGYILKDPYFIVSDIFKDEKLFSPEIYKALRQATAGAYEPEKIKKQISAVLIDKLDKASIQEKLAWYQTPLGQKIMGLEKIKADPADEQTFISQLESAPPSQQRSELARRLNEIAGTAKNYAEVVYRMFLAINSALNAALPPEQRFNAGKSQQLAEELRSEIMSVTEKTVNLKSTLYRYRALSDEELSAYATHCQSDFEKKYSEELLAALESVLSKESEEVGKATAAILLKSQ
jgi:hypothetical protein